MEDSEASLFFYFIFGTVVKYVALASVQKRRLNCAEYIGRLSAANLFPLKSCKAVKLKETECTNSGLATTGGGVLDRRWMVVTPDGNFVTGRKHPKLVLIEVSIHDNRVELNAPGMTSLSLPLDQQSAGSKIVKTKIWRMLKEAVDCGEEASAWISGYLDTPDLRLVFSPPDLANRNVSQLDVLRWYAGAKDTDEVAFQDGFPYMLTSEASLGELNNRLQKSVSMENFRPNLVVTGCDAFDEDNWDTIQIGPVRFKNSKPCTRCTFITVDPKTGKKDDDVQPLKTLRKYRLLYREFGDDPCFGINLVVEKPGRIRLWDPVYVTRKLMN